MNKSAFQLYEGFFIFRDNASKTNSDNNGLLYQHHPNKWEYKEFKIAIAIAIYWIVKFTPI